MIRIEEKELRSLLVDEGLTDLQAAGRLGVSKETVRRRRIKLGITSKPKRPEGYYGLTEAQELRLSELYAKGYNDYQVASEMHLGRNRLREWRREHDIASQTNKKGLTKDICEEVYDRHLAGGSFEDIGRDYDVTRTSLSKHMKKHGYLLEVRNQRRPEDVDSYKLTDNQVAFLVGDLFGDGHVVETSKKTAYYISCHNKKQESFVAWKYNIFMPISSAMTYGDQLNERTEEREEIVTTRTFSSKCFLKWRREFYPKGDKYKVLKPHHVEYMNWISLAVWFMGDGTRGKNKIHFVVGKDIDVPPIVESLNIKFGNIFGFRNYRRQWNIYIYDLDKFLSMAGKYILPYFKYKIPAQYHHYCNSSISFQTVYGNKEFTNKIFELLSLPEQQSLVKEAVSFYRNRGFPYPYFTKGAIFGYYAGLKSCVAKEENQVISATTSGTKICNHFFPHRYDAKHLNSRPMDIWDDDKKLTDFLWNRFKYFNAPFTDTTIRTGISLKSLPANFNPSVAKFIYQRYPGDVLDFCAGYGGRLLGWMASETRGSYTGIEPYSKSYGSLCKMSKFLAEDLSKVTIKRTPFEDCSFPEGSFDLAFSSPPYFALEDYGDEPTQSIKRYPDYQDWLLKFWFAAIEKCFVYLRPSGHLIYSLSNYGKYDLIGDTLRFIKGLDFKQQESYYIRYHNVYKNKDKLEEIFVFKKV